MRSIELCVPREGRFPEIPKSSPVRRRIEAAGVSPALALALADLFPMAGRDHDALLVSVTAARIAEACAHG